MGRIRFKKESCFPEPKTSRKKFTLEMKKFVYFKTARIPRLKSRQTSIHLLWDDLTEALYAFRSSLDICALCSFKYASCA